MTGGNCGRFYAHETWTGVFACSGEPGEEGARGTGWARGLVTYGLVKRRQCMFVARGIFYLIRKVLMDVRNW